MNERIRELWDKAAESTAAYPSGQNNSWETQVNFMDMFAELIVRECMEINKQELSFIAFETLMDRYNEHFGLEESKGWVCPKCGIDRTKDVCPNGHMAAIEGKCPMIVEAR